MSEDGCTCCGGAGEHTCGHECYACDAGMTLSAQAETPRQICAGHHGRPDPDSDRYGEGWTHDPDPVHPEEVPPGTPAGVEALTADGSPRSDFMDTVVKTWEATESGQAEITHAGFAVQAADSGRVLLIQRTWDEEDAPEVRGTWEFPGGGLEDAEDPEAAARREFSEETGLPIPPGETTGGWRSPDGIYQGYVFTTPVEADAFPELNPDLAAAEMVNPDDPERRTPDVSAWFTIEQIQNLGTALRPEVYNTDWTQFAGGGLEEEAMTAAAPEFLDPVEEKTAVCGKCGAELTKGDAGWMGPGGEGCPEGGPHEPAEDAAPAAPPSEKTPKPFADEGLIPWHAVLCVENHRSGDGRGMRALRRRPLPLPMSWQKVSSQRHDGSVVTQRMDRMVRVGQEIRACGVFLPNAEADELIGLVSHFPKFGVSIDADSTEITLAYDDEETGTAWYENARIASASALAIPAFAEAWMAMGEGPEGFMDGEELDEDIWENALVASAADTGVQFMAAAVETFLAKTEDGPGWVTHPVDTDRLRDYWVRGAGAAKIGWGTPGDFNRCRINVAEYVKPQHLNGYCANRHYDALGFWPGHAPSEQMGQEPTLVTAPEGVSSFRIVDREETAIIASAAGFCAPAEWFEDPQFAKHDGRMVQGEDGTWGAPMQVTEDGRVFGHIAKWGVCHTGMPKNARGECQTAPHSESGYAYFLLGQVLTTEGMIPCGSLTVGGGHADLHLGVRAAMAHYDSTSSVWANVNVGEDQFGIWCAGWVPPGVKPEKVIEARASKMSGDWRPVGRYGQYEMMAALSVNTPGFVVPRIGIAAGMQTALVAAGVVTDSLPASSQAPFDLDALAARLEERAAARVEQAALMETLARAEQAALVAQLD